MGSAVLSPSSRLEKRNASSTISVTETEGMEPTGKLGKLSILLVGRSFQQSQLISSIQFFLKVYKVGHGKIGVGVFQMMNYILS